MNRGRSLVMALAALAAGLMCAEAQVLPTTTGALSQLPVAVTNATTLATNSTAITVRQGKGLAVFPKFHGTGASTSDVTFHFDVSIDGTNYTTTRPLTAVVPLNGTNLVTGFKLFAPSALDHVRTIRISAIQNAGSVGCVIDGVDWSIGN